jgi:hypothetical protein
LGRQGAKLGDNYRLGHWLYRLYHRLDLLNREHLLYRLYLLHGGQLLNLLPAALLRILRRLDLLGLGRLLEILVYLLLRGLILDQGRFLGGLDHHRARVLVGITLV